MQYKKKLSTHYESDPDMVLSVTVGSMTKAQVKRRSSHVPDTTIRLGA